MAALIGDLRDRHLNRDVLVIAMGEFGRTPRVNSNGGCDNWPAVMSVLLAGGSYRIGQAIGASGAHGAVVVRTSYLPQRAWCPVLRDSSLALSRRKFVQLVVRRRIVGLELQHTGMEP